MLSFGYIELFSNLLPSVIQSRFMNVNILLVEDNPADRALTSEALRETDWVGNMEAVGDGVEALRYLRKSGRYAESPQPDLIILDLNLPKKDGREVLKEVKGDARLKKIPVIVLSSSSADSDINVCYELSANCFISKPVDLDSFFSVIRDIEQFWFRSARLPTH